MENTQTDDLTEYCLNSQLVHEGKVIQLKIDEISLPNGKMGKREVVLHNGGVVIVPIRNDNKFILVEQYRYAIGQRLLEFPAGRLNKGEDPQEAASRELIEETGYRAGKIKKLGRIFTAPGFSNECLHIYLATELTEGKAQPDEDEFVEPIVFSKEELAHKIQNGEVHDAKTLSAWALIHSN